jgi:prepilin peptidase CpaA
MVVLSAVLILAAVIDGWKLKVPNWLTYSLIVAGWCVSAWSSGWEGFGQSLLGAVLGLALLMPLYAVGGMGAGDVKLLAGIGAWVGPATVFYAFCVSAIVGAVLAVLMVLVRGEVRKHLDNLRLITCEFWVIRNPRELAAIAAARKPTMMLLPYGIPIAIGTISYFFCVGLL